MQFSIRDLFWLMLVAATWGWTESAAHRAARLAHVRQGHDLEDARRDAKYWKAFSDYFETQYKSLWVQWQSEQTG